MFNRSRSGVEYVKKSWIIFLSLALFSIFFQLSNAHFGVLLARRTKELCESHKFHFLLKNSIARFIGKIEYYANNISIE